MTKPCQCHPLPAGQAHIVCPRHNISKTAGQVALCAEREALRDQWDRGEGPGQASPQQRRQHRQIIDRLEHKRRRLGRQLWMELHRFPYKRPSWEPDKACQWYKRWLQRVNRMGCACHNDFHALTADLPPDFATAEAFFEWTVEAHNRVNQKLGKPIVGLELARRITKCTGGAIESSTSGFVAHKRFTSLPPT